MQLTDTSIVLDTANVQQTWCAFEHQAVLQPGHPPEVILVGVCRLIDVYRLIEPRSNSEWTGVFLNGGHVLVRIIATSTDRNDVTKYAGSHMRTFDPMPRCNLRGFNTKHNSRPIKCNENGVVYPSQKHAADDLGLMQSAISRHLHGHLKHVKGKTFTYYAGS